MTILVLAFSNKAILSYIQMLISLFEYFIMIEAVCYNFGILVCIFSFVFGKNNMYIY